MSILHEVISNYSSEDRSRVEVGVMAHQVSLRPIHLNSASLSTQIYDIHHPNLPKYTIQLPYPGPFNKTHVDAAARDLEECC